MNNSDKQDGRRRVVITGMAVTSCVGLTVNDLWESCRSGKSGVKSCRGNDEYSPLDFFAPADAFTANINDFGELPDGMKKSIRKGLKLMSREIQMGVASAQRALYHAGIPVGSTCPERTGVSFASDYIITTPEEILDGVKACSSDGTFDFAQWPAEGLTRMTPIWQLKFLPNMPASHICIYNEFRGPCNAITNREASVAAAMGESTEIIRAGKADMMIVGATGSRLLPFKRIHTMDHDRLAEGTMAPEEACRPFDLHRIGTVPGEGAAALILEDEESALKRGATIYAEVVGASYRRACLPQGTVTTNLPLGNIEESLVLSMKTLFDRFGIDPSVIGHINACGFGDPEGDAAEARAIRSVFGASADTVPVTGLKGVLGNPGAAGGVMELIASILAMNENQLFPLYNNTEDDPACPIRPVRTFGGPAGDIFLKLAYEKFGQSGAVLVKKWA